MDATTNKPLRPRRRTPQRRTPPPASRAGILFRPRASRTCSNPALSTYGRRPSRMTGVKRALAALGKIVCTIVIVAALVLVTRMLSQSTARDAAASEMESNVSQSLRALIDPIDDDERASLIENLADSPADYTSHVSELLQGDAYPSGCEPAALASVLQSMGVDASLEDVLGYLSYDPDFIDFVYHYAGDPAGSGSAWPPAMVDAANRYLTDATSDATSIDADVVGEGKDGSAADTAPPLQTTPALTAVNISGASFSEVTDIIAAGYPVMVWTTMYMEEPDFSDYAVFGYQFVVNNHCVVAYGLSNDESTVLAMDPLEGMVERNADDFARIYEERGCLALVVVPEDALA